MKEQEDDQEKEVFFLKSPLGPFLFSMAHIYNN